MKGLKKRWEKELDEMLPELSSNVRNTPLPAVERAQRCALLEWISSHRRQFYTYVATGVAAVTALCITLPTFFKTEAVLPPEKNSEAVYAVKINPEAVFSVDKEGKVTSVMAVNEDADVILSDKARENAIVGEEIAEAVSIFVDYAAQLGYLDMDVNSAVRVSACEGEESLQTVQKGVQNYFRSKGVFGIVVTENLTLEQFTSQLGIIAEDTQTLAESIVTMPTLYTARETDGKSDAELEEWYRSYYTDEEIFDVFKEAVSLPPGLEHLLSEITASNLQAQLGFLKKFGIDVSGLEELYTIPASKAECQEKLGTYMQNRYKKREKENKDTYEKDRQSIDEEAYEAYVRNIIEEHGSLINYWNKNQKNKKI